MSENKDLEQHKTDSAQKAVSKPTADEKAKAAAAAKAKAQAAAKKEAAVTKEKEIEADIKNEEVANNSTTEGSEKAFAKDSGSQAQDKAKAASDAKAKAAAAAKAKAQAAAKAKSQGDSGSGDDAKAKAAAAAKAKAAAAAKAKAAAAAKAKAQGEGDSGDDAKAKAVAAAKAKAAAAAKAKAAAVAKAGSGKAATSAEEEKPSPNQHYLDKYVKVIEEHLGKDVLEDSYINRLSKDVPTLVVKPDQYYRVAEFLKYNEQLGFDFLSESHGTDFVTHMEVYVHLYSYKNKQSVALKVKLDRDEPIIDSLQPLWAGAEWPECETYDLLGIKFRNHPNLRRIMLGEDWVGYPLRKDYEPYDVEV